MPSEEKTKKLTEADKKLKARVEHLSDVEIDVIIAADCLNDVEKARIANSNRLDSLARVKGFDIDDEEAPPQIRAISAVGDTTKAAEDMYTEALKQAFRYHPLSAWRDDMKDRGEISGLGEKQLGRFLGPVPRPHWNFAESRVRTGPAELWAYCGMHVVDGVAPARRRGSKANWNSEARTRIRMCAESIVKASVRKLPGCKDVPHKFYDLDNRKPLNRYGEVYLSARHKYLDAVHAHQCAQCGPSGSPAQPGSPISLGHQNARAIRAVAKELLKDLYNESMRLHDEGVW